MDARRIVSLLAVATFAIASPYAYADDDDDDDERLPLGAFGQFGIGFVTRTGDTLLANDSTTAFDGTFRVGKTWRPTDRIWPGGFLELRTVSFDTFEAAIGPQVQLRLHDSVALQLRGGVGAVAEGESYALAGLQVGTYVIGVTVTARRYFDEERTELAANLELSTLLALLPLAMAAWR